MALPDSFLLFFIELTGYFMTLVRVLVIFFVTVSISLSVVQAQSNFDENRALGLDMRDSPVSNVLQILAEVAGVNLLLAPTLKSPSYKCNVTIQSRNSTWKSALNEAKKQCNLEAEIVNGRILVVAPDAADMKAMKAAIG
jgi:hypothetical protein